MIKINNKYTIMISMTSAKTGSGTCKSRHLFHTTRFNEGNNNNVTI